MLGMPLHPVPEDTNPLHFQFNDVSRLDPLIKLHTRTKAYGTGTDDSPGRWDRPLTDKLSTPET